MKTYTDSVKQYVARQFGIEVATDADVTEFIEMAARDMYDVQKNGAAWDGDPAGTWTEMAEAEVTDAANS